MKTDIFFLNISHKSTKAKKETYVLFVVTLFFRKTKIESVLFFFFFKFSVSY